MKSKDKIEGCLFGGAAGDALGYPVEFLEDRVIFEKYGENGISEYDLADGVAQVSDDTQMTLYTANGLLLGTIIGATLRIKTPYRTSIEACYEDWLRTQNPSQGGHEQGKYSWLNNIPEMNHKRAPGTTCISCISQKNYGSTTKPKNKSKGCGGLMRVAPVGLYFEESPRLPLEAIDKMGAEVAALTHGHELGYIPAAMLVHIINVLCYNTDVTILAAVEDAKDTMLKLFPTSEYLPYLIELINKAIELSKIKEIDDLDGIRELGEGWVAEETLAIAVYCALKYEHDFERAIIAAVNHSGDSDSTGSVTGNIMGASLGLKGIPSKYVNNLELKDTILEIADDLYKDCRMTGFGNEYDEIWGQKYIYHTFPNGKQ